LANFTASISTFQVERTPLQLHPEAGQVTLKSTESPKNINPQLALSRLLKSLDSSCPCSFTYRVPNVRNWKAAVQQVDGDDRTLRADFGRLVFRSARHGYPATRSMTEGRYNAATELKVVG
jgi:hypothetical protein